MSKEIMLIDAPEGQPVLISRILDQDLALHLHRMGLFPKQEITRLDQEVQVQPVKIRGPQGEAVLGGGMAMKIVVHTDNEQKLPLSEMQPRESGHIEGISGGQTLNNVLQTLGLHLEDHIVFVRKLPPMVYNVLIKGNGRVRLTEGMAAKIWGQMQDQDLQFIVARSKEAFHVKAILGGMRAENMLKKSGIEPGRIIVLESVSQAQNVQIGVRSTVAVTNREGLRLFITPHHARQILVQSLHPGERYDGG
ncbi:MAG: FeoA domain-containing protein [Desulfovermiculus sp.]